MKYVSIRNKLTALARKVLLGSSAAFLLSGAALGAIYTFYTLNDIRRQTEQDLISRGSVLILNNSQALRGLAEDNAFIAVRELVVSTVNKDDDVIYGIYMDADRQPWVLASEGTPDGEVTEKYTLQDSLSIWASGIIASDFKRVGTGEDAVIEFAAPVVSGSDKLGTIRYGFSTIAMKRAVEQSKRSFLISMGVFAGIMVVVILAVYFIGAKMAKSQANAITRPLDELTSIAGEISRGNYTTRVATVSNDEIGELALNFETMRQTIKNYTDNLEQMVATRTRQLEDAQKEIVEKAHKAGMADIATAVLHNVGNILTSVVVSGNMIREKTRASRVKNLVKANAMLKDNLENLDEFILRDPKGKKLLEYYLALEPLLKEENQSVIEHSERLISKIDAIRDVISSQQSYASEGSLTEKMVVNDIVNDAINIQLSGLQKTSIEVVREMRDTPPVNVQKVKLIHIIINILKNARESLVASRSEERKIVVRTEEKEGRVVVRISDNGEGIRLENREKIFSHGFTTKKTGHGFGLHSSANYMTEMGGTMHAESDGEGKGATFVLSFPVPGENGNQLQKTTGST